LGFAAAFCTLAAVEEVALSKISENTRPGFVAIKRPRRAFLQFLHHNHVQLPLCWLVQRAVSRNELTILIRRYYQKNSCSCYILLGLKPFRYENRNTQLIFSNHATLS
jgi:hypothetical protein